jgi:hypothetical protein
MKREDYQSLLTVLREESEGMSFEDARVVANRLRFYATKLDAIATRQCNGHQTPQGDWDEVAAKLDDEREAKIEDSVRKIGVTYGLQFHFDGDPRGFVLKMKTPKSGRYNTWGGRETGWGIGEND